MNLSLSIDLFAKAQLAESVATPGEHLSEILFLSTLVLSISISALDLLSEDAHFFCLINGGGGLSLFILGMLETFMSSSSIKFIHL